MIVKHEIKDSENQEVLTTIILNLGSVVSAKMSPEGFISVSLQSGVTYDTESANAGSRMMAQLFWDHLTRACNPITVNSTEGNVATVSLKQEGVSREKQDDKKAVGQKTNRQDYKKV